MTQAPIKPKLYERDLQLWFGQTLDCLRSRDFENLDLEALVEEIEGLAGRDRREIKSFLKLLFMHTLKRCYVPSPDTFNHWVSEIEEFQSQLSEILEQSPSLKNFFRDAIPEAYIKALTKVQKLYPKVSFPNSNPFPTDIETLLETPFWEIIIHD